MASWIYDETRKVLGGVAPTHSDIDLNDDAISVFFVDEADDTPNQVTDIDAADRLAASQVPAFASAPALGTAGTRVTMDTVMKFDAADLVFTALTGDPVESIDMFKDSGTDTTSPMIANFQGYTGMPLTPSGTDVTIVWAATGIIRI